MPASSTEGITGIAAALDSTFRHRNNSSSCIKAKSLPSTSVDSDNEEDDFADAWEEGLINHEVTLLYISQIG